MTCKLCQERQTEINRILKAYRKDKKIYGIVIAILMGELILTIAYGSDGILLLVNILMRWFGK
jgi:hypothetical protein